MTAADEVFVRYPFDRGDGLDVSAEYRKARMAPGLIRVKMPFGDVAWLITRYDDARLVLGDPRFSRAAAAARDEPRTQAVPAAVGLLCMDPPDHTRLRRLVSKAFTRRGVERLRPRVREIATSLIDGMVTAGPPADLVDAFALPLPVLVICELLGVPAGDRVRFRVWSDIALSTAPLTVERYQQNYAELCGYLAALIRQRRAEPVDDLMSALITARDEEDRLAEEELVDLCVLLLLAGHETSATQIPNFVFVLMQNPWSLATLREHPGLIPDAVEELSRYVPIDGGGAFARYALEDVEVGGTLVRAGEAVVVAFNSANRDETRFTDPDDLVFDREFNSHLAFGHGVHRCLGAPLAQMELQESLHALLTHMPSLRLAGDPDWKSDMLLRGPRRMRVEW